MVGDSAQGRQVEQHSAFTRPIHSDGAMSAPIELTYPVFSRPVAVGVRVG